MVQLREDLVEVLDEEAERRGISRSALIREAVEAHLSTSMRALVGRRIVAGYERIPAGEPDEWGSLDDLADTSTREVMQRLDDEEAASGFEPW